MSATPPVNEGCQRGRGREGESAAMPIMLYLYQQGRAPHSSNNLNPTTLRRELWENWPLSSHRPCTLQYVAHLMFSSKIERKKHPKHGAGYTLYLFWQ